MQFLSKELDCLNIKVRNYLNITAYSQFMAEYENYLIRQSIPYFWFNSGTLVTDYIINTIDGPIQHPVIGIKRLYVQKEIHQECAISVLQHDERFRKRCLLTAILAVNRAKYIPIELVIFILRYSGLIKMSTSI